MNRLALDSSSLAPPDEEVVALVARLTSGDDAAAERRGEKRYRFSARVAVVALDDAGRPAGEPWTVLTSSISPSGVGFVSGKLVASRQFAMELPLPHLPQFLLEVAWQKPISEFFVVGARIIEQLA